MIYCYIARNKKKTACCLDEDSISFTVQAKNKLEKRYTFRYADIDRIHLGLPDIAWHTMDIYFRDKTHIHLKSVTFFVERDGKLKRPKLNDADRAAIQKNETAYRHFVVELHKRVSLPEVAKKIRLTHGNPWKKTLIWLLLLALATCIPIAWKVGSYRWSFVFGTGFLILLFFSTKINFRKHYLAHDIPQKYLP